LGSRIPESYSCTLVESSEIDESMMEKNDSMMETTPEDEMTEVHMGSVL
jgi:hypothetical protein